MIGPRHHRAVRSRKKSTIPLSKLRTSEVVRAVVDHPRRLGELATMLEDKDRTVRGRAAATLARLAETHAVRLVRILDRLKEGLGDDAAYVRWSLAYTLGRIGACHPVHAPGFLPDLLARTNDENRLVRILALKALGRVAERRPQLIRDLFAEKKQPVPPTLERYLRRAKGQSPNPAISR